VRTRALFARIEEELAGLPGASAATSAQVPLISGSNWVSSVKVQGFASDENNRPSASFNSVGAGHFRAIGVALLAGREFTNADDMGHPKVAIVNETFAKKFNLGANPVGKRIALGSADTLPLNIEIVGLVRDTKYSSVKSDVPHRQQSNVGDMYFYVRTAGEPAAMLRAMSQVVQRVDATLPVENLRTLPEEIRRDTFIDRMISTLSASFAALATLLAAIGLYGVLAYSVAQRTREIGVRMALGADTSQVLAMILSQVARMVLVGGILGVAGALALSKAAQSMLFQMTGADPVVMSASVLVLAVVALAAGFVPARRASRVDPMQALRYE
jgi:predicted permease